MNIQDKEQPKLIAHKSKERGYFRSNGTGKPTKLHFLFDDETRALCGWSHHFAEFTQPKEVKMFSDLSVRVGETLLLKDEVCYTCFRLLFNNNTPKHEQFKR